MNKHLIWIILILLAASLACSQLAPDAKPVVESVQTVAPQPPPADTLVPVVEAIPTNTAEPPAPTLTPAYGKAQIGFFLTTYLIFDPAIWQAQLKADASQTTNGLEAYELVHQPAGCVIRENLGFGPPTTWEYNEYSRQIGGAEFKVERWVETLTGQPVLLVYQYPAASADDARRIELFIEEGADACIADTEAVLALSVTNLEGD